MVETLAIILSCTALVVLAMLVGRLLGTLLKIALVVGLLYLVVTRVDFSHSTLCQSPVKKPHGNSSVLSGFFCRP